MIGDTIRMCKTGHLFIVFFVAAMFLPRVVKKGLFGDGLLYASMSRNMSENIGSFWRPYFSSSYWIENMPATYYENPPLMLWVQSLLFRCTGDHWWVEKLFSFLVLILNLFFFRFLWRVLFTNQPELKKYWYLVVFFWYIIPVVIWGNVNNLMDNLLLSFCLAAVALTLKSFVSRDNTDYIALICAAVCVFLGILTKGPVALYPLSVPFVYYIIKGDLKFRQMLKITFSSGFISVFLLLFLLMIEKDALFFFQQYWEQRLKAVIIGNRDDMKLAGWGRLYILFQLIVELSPTIILILSGWIFTRIKNWKIDISPYKKEIFFFTMMGISATTPILLSTKQSGIYLIPGIPMFSVAAALVSLPFLKKMKTFRWFQANVDKIKYFFIISIAVVFLYSALQFGKPGREVDLMHDIEIINNIVPKGSKLGVCQEMKKEFVLHTYLQRMGKYELINYSDMPEYMLWDHFCIDSPVPVDMGTYAEIDLKSLKYFKLFRKK